MLSLIKNNMFTRVLGPQAAGTGTTNTTGVDCTGLDVISWLTDFGTIVTGAAVTIKKQGSIDNSTWVDLASTLITVADTADNKLVLTEEVRPHYRYMRIVIIVATQNATINLVVAITGTNVRQVPVTQPTGSVSQSVQTISSIAGTP